MIIVYWYDMIPIKIIIAFLDKSFHVKQVFLKLQPLKSNVSTHQLELLKPEEDPWFRPFFRISSHLKHLHPHSSTN